MEVFSTSCVVLGTGAHALCFSRFVTRFVVTVPQSYTTNHQTTRRGQEKIPWPAKQTGRASPPSRFRRRKSRTDAHNHTTRCTIIFVIIFAETAAVATTPSIPPKGSNTPRNKHKPRGDVTSTINIKSFRSLLFPRTVVAGLPAAENIAQLSSKVQIH